MGAGASTYDGASNSGNSLSDMAAGDVAAFVADQGEDFEAYKQPLIEQGLDGKALTNISAEELEAAMESAKIEEAHREILRECCAKCGVQCGAIPGGFRKRTARAPCCSGGGEVVVLEPELEPTCSSAS
jgi:hypothetical protein